MRTKIALTLTLLMASGASSYAAPGNISVSGIVSGGQTISITGSDFGTKTQGPPELWDNFESATNGSALTGRVPTIGSVAWGTLGNPVASTSNHRTNSTTSYFGDFSNGVYNNSVYYLRTETTTGAKKYFSFWWRGGRAGDTWSRNMKPWQHFGSGSDQPMYYIGDGTGDGDPGFRSNVIDNTSSLAREGSSYGCGNMESKENQWIRWEGYIVLSDPGVQNGRMEVWLSQPGTITRSNCIHHPTAVTRSTSNGFRQWAFGEYMDTAGGDSIVYMDDIYIDNTLARVELCDTSTWSTVTHCEVQPQTAWSTTSITTTVNTGSFQTDQTAYLYVVDANGDANATGYEVTIEESISPTPINGSCGSNNGATLSSLTSGNTNNCSTGNVSGFTGTGPWSWTCAGLNGGDNSGTCSASLAASVGGMRISIGATMRISAGSTPISVQ